VDELLPVTNPPDLSGVELTFEEEQGLSHPDWKRVSKAVRETKPKTEWWNIFHELSKQWLLQLKTDLGGNCHVFESENFLFLSAEGSAATGTMMQYAESSLASLQKSCGELFASGTYGKRAVLVFTDPDDYYAYVSHFHIEGAHSLSSGMMLHSGYFHIAFPFTWVFSSRRIIIHELVHNCIAHLPISTWLHEALAQKLERMALNQSFSLDRDLAAEHHAHWTEQNIQEFWPCASFYVADERNKLSYSLSEILIELLSTDWQSFLAFVLEADYRDAGQDASVRILARCLGETIAEFLGPGNWRPQRKAIAEYQRARKEAVSSLKNSG
jgi:hypothetical protein